MTTAHLITLDPGHFHAALVQKEMYGEVAPQVHVYAPLGPDLLAHLQRIAGFNQRPDHPTAWEMEVHAGPDFLERMLRERPGNVVILAGRNERKMQYIQAAVEAGLNVLADKPWIIAGKQRPLLQTVLDNADQKGLVAYDIMTERFEITSLLQREMVQDAEIFGTPVAGTQEQPGVFMESVHYLKKQVAGVPLKRPASFFDIQQQGEGLNDVGTHLVDLVPWMLCPNQAIDHRNEIAILSARRWPTVLGRAEFEQVTGEANFPASLRPHLEGDRLPYYCNTQVSYTLRGLHVQLRILWDFEAAPGAGDTHLAILRGSRSRIEVRQGPEERFRPEVYVISEPGNDVRSVVKRRVAALQTAYPGLAVEDQKERQRLIIPESYRVGHEAHFGEVTKQFLRYLQKKDVLPAWEKPNMLAKYFVTTEGVEVSRGLRFAPAG
jgi:predicted dehydrogenase